MNNNLQLMGEFGLIDKFHGLVKKTMKFHNKNVIVGIGDDAAVIKPNRKKSLLTCDMLIEDVHFSAKSSDYFQIGYKSMAVNISDIAAMGGVPDYALVSLGIPENSSLKNIISLFNGICKCSSRYNVEVVGGDTVSSPCGLVINIALVGEISNKNNKAALRSSARNKDKILVTGTLGDSAAGLKIAEKKKYYANYLKKLTRKFQMPVPRINESKVIMRSKRVHSMIDISDGLANEINHICRLSSTGAGIYEEKIPISAELLKFCSNSRKTALKYALFGGEDYELLFTVPARYADDVVSAVGKKTGTNVTVIGDITDKFNKVKLIDSKDNTRDLKPEGYEHFKNRK